MILPRSLPVVLVGWACLQVLLHPSASAEEKVAQKQADSSAPKEGRRANRLAHEKSPYLLQHAFNPVDWFPWGPEAFAHAQAEKKPIFLSIGYSTCHWCHVMERESFEDDEVAAYLNEHFVPIKVDREERPDVDEVYMTAVQAIVGRGGWPLSVFLTPEGKPFYGGTYFPARDGDRGAQIGFLTLLGRVVEAWSSQRPGLESQADRILAVLKRSAGAAVVAESLEEAVLTQGYTQLLSAHDSEHGGFGSAPKFPRTSNLDFLMRYGRGHPAQRDSALAMVYRTLDAMIRGGIRDHLAGGFHRYSVDRVWLVPHFEKMLYDQGLITRTLLDAYRLSGEARYLEVASETMDYLLERMRGPDGEIYSAEDADTAHVEGQTYTWTRAEILSVLGEKRGERFSQLYGVSEEGNFEEGGHNVAILNLEKEGAFETLAESEKLTLTALQAELEGDRARLLAVRDKREQPLRDDKVLTAWNGMAISALAELYQAGGDEKYLRAARAAGDFVRKHLMRDGLLARRYRGGETIGVGFLEDYAFFTQGLLDLYEAGFDASHLKEAVRLGQAMVELFWDQNSGGFFLSSPRHEELIVRSKEYYDGAVPSGNSVAFLNLTRLAAVTDVPIFEEKAKTLESIAAALLKKSTLSHPLLLCGAADRLRQPRTVVVVGPTDAPLTRELVREVQRGYFPATALIHAASDQAVQELAPFVGILKGLPLKKDATFDGKPAAYVLQRGVWKEPARDLMALKALLAG
jgi:uncharacterized protein YyaL (SSP411 family)